MFYNIVSFIFLSFSVAIASPHLTSPIVHHKTALPALWQESRVADKAHLFQLSIALQKDSHVAEALYNISTPGHAQYGQHLTQQEAQRLLSPDIDSHDEILKWLVTNDIDLKDIKVDGHWIRFLTTVAKANKLLEAEFKWYFSPRVEKEVLRTLQYSVPRALYSKISVISPTTRFCSKKPEIVSTMQYDQNHYTEVRDLQHVSQPIDRRATIDPACNRTITPDCIRALYNVPANLSVSTARGLGVYGSQDQVAKYTDFQLFTKNIDPKSKAANFTVVSVNGGTVSQAVNKQASDEELNFDIQYTAAIWSGMTPIPTVQYSIGGQGPIQPELGNQPGDGTEPWLQWLDYLLALPDAQLPHTITTSFGEDEQSLPAGYIQQVCNQFGALGARGVSMLVASGDSGPGSSCVSNDGSNATRLTAIFPGSCPYVTAVGGTKGVNPEVAVVFSAGGFSDKFARPAYQDQAVPAYLKTLGDRFSGLFNASGRGFPDVASQAFNITFATEGRVGGFAGTRYAFTSLSQHKANE